MQVKSYFITGVAGFIGSNTAEALLRQGHRVIGFDNLEPVYSVEKKQFNLEQLRAAAPGAEAFTFIHGDLREPEAVQKALAQGPIDVVVHLGALAGVQPSIDNPRAYAEVNILGTLNVLEATVTNKIPALVFASSSSVYGGNQKLPFSESDAVDHPLSPYAATKRAGELLAHSYHHLHGLNVACLRFFTVYGPRQRPDLAIYKFTRAMLKGEHITLYGDGDSSRDYTYIDDCVSGIQKAADWAIAGTALAPRYDIFNLGEAETVRLKELVALLEKLLKVKVKKKIADYLPGDVFATRADLGHSQKVLGYTPKIKIEEGLRRFCDWYLRDEKNKPWA
jgi:UDP-glucuronate 4-epimerase